ALVGAQEVALEVEVLGRVAGNAELGEDHEVGARVAGAADPLGDLGGVGIDGADGGVDLGEGEAHAGSIAIVTARRYFRSPLGFAGHAEPSAVLARVLGGAAPGDRCSQLCPGCAIPRARRSRLRCPEAVPDA